MDAGNGSTCTRAACLDSNLLEHDNSPLVALWAAILVVGMWCSLKPLIATFVYWIDLLKNRPHAPLNIETVVPSFHNDWAFGCYIEARLLL
jgi:hypothetical protein